MNNKNKYVSCRIIDHECASRRIIESKYVSCGIIDNEIKNNLFFNPTSLSPRMHCLAAAQVRRLLV